MSHFDPGGSALCFDDRPACRGERGPTLLLIHGLLGSRAFWDDLTPLLGGCRVLSVDLPGHGDSGPARAGMTLDELAGELVSLLDHARAGEVVAIGASLGANLALRIA